MIVVNSIGTL